MTKNMTPLPNSPSLIYFVYKTRVTHYMAPAAVPEDKLLVSLQGRRNSAISIVWSTSCINYCAGV